MHRYAKMNNGSVESFIDLTDEQVAEIPEHKRHLVVPAPITPAPAFDRTTHHAPVRQPDVIHADWVEQVWSDPVPKTQAEIDAEILDAQNSQLARMDTPNGFEMALAKALFQMYNEMKALHSEPQITLDQFKDYLKALM